ncbi:MAG: hypothetical protein LBN98_03685 [Prevotellaceae bacterium]|jgi:hypothetical protein|nr:hypothetical protein [Prevotellaceae bacterium]
MDYTENYKEYFKLKNQLTEQRIAYLRYILLITSTLMGLLISLHGSTIVALSVRLAFACSMVLICIGLLTGAVAVYLLSITARKNLVEDYQHKLQDARTTSSAMLPVSGHPPKLFAVCEKTCYIALLLAVVSLTLYAVSVA